MTEVIKNKIMPWMFSSIFIYDHKYEIQLPLYCIDIDTPIYKCTWYQYYIDIISSLWNTTLIEALFRINIVPSWRCLTLVSISTISYQYRFTCMTRQIIMNNIKVSIVILCTMSSINIDIIIGLNSLVCFVQFKMIKVSHCSQQ